MKTQLLIQALFLVITPGLSLFLLACGEPSEPIQEARDERNLTSEQNIFSVPEISSNALKVIPPSPARIETNSDSQEAFTIVAHNVQNLFDLDGASQYADYKPEYYGASQLQRKLANLTNLLARFGEGSGPDVVLLQEIELDRTPKEVASATELLKKALDNNDLGPYYLAKGRIKELPLEKSPAIVCVTLSKFPIKETRNHWAERARPILETHLDVKGQILVVFNNHWKSGASSVETEPIRIQNATVLRNRINDLLNENPATDIVVGGDLNSHYNQKQVFEGVMQKTAINDVLLSQGNEPLMQSPTPKLYNLWHELEPRERGSDVWRGEWGTLMHLVLSHGLYDAKGIQYVGDSFRSVRQPGFNVDPVTGTPRRWSNDFGGHGVSDHLPIIATFRTATKGEPVAIGKNYYSAPRELPQVDYSKALTKAKRYTPDMATQANYGKIFRFSGNLAQQKPLTLETEGHSIRLWSFDQLAKEKLFALKKGDELSGYGNLSRYRGKWQLLIENATWLIK